MDDPIDAKPVAKPDVAPDAEFAALAADEELPVVARMVVEIRSDGTRTVARGAIEDRIGDQQVAVEAEAGSPLELSAALTKLLLSAPLTAVLGRARGGTPAEPRPGLVRGVVGALGRKLGDKLGEQLDRLERGRPSGRERDERP